MTIRSINGSHAGLGLATAMLLFALPAAPSASADDFFGIFGGEKGSGELVTEIRELESFDRSTLEGSMDLFVTVGEPISVAVSIDDNLQDNVTTRVTGRGTLRISTDDIRRSHRKPRVDITLPSLERLRIEGSGDVEVHALSEDFLKIDVDGSGDVRLEGHAARLYVAIDGSGDVDAEDLIAVEVDVDINGSGDVTGCAEGAFSGSINGSGDIRVYGDPGSFSRRISGSGDIVRR
jgi:hypothetical protein